MTNLGKMAAAFLLSATPVFAQEDSAAKLEGAWHMVSLEAGAPGGEMAKTGLQGQIVFTDAGTVSVQAINPAGDSPENPYTIAGYEAYYGSYAVDAATVTFTVDAALVRSLIGQKFERAFQVSGDQLVLTPTNDQENWRATYERY